MPPAMPIDALVRRYTEDGRLIVGFLVSTMQGDIPGGNLSHALQACRLLIKLGFSDAQLPDDDAPNAPARADTGRPSRRRNARPSKLEAELARFARDETDGGRDAVRFLVDVMQGNVPDFKPHHRIAAARELLRRGFDRQGGPDAPPEPDAVPEQEPEPREVPEGFRVTRRGVIFPDFSIENCAVVLNEDNMKVIGWRRYSKWLREMKGQGRAILRSDWWCEELEEFVDEDAPTLIEAIQQAAEAQGITVAPHLLEATWLDMEQKRQKAASRPETGHELYPEDEFEEDDVDRQDPDPEPVVADEDTNVPWSKPGYHYPDELSAHEKKVLDKGGTLYWDTPGCHSPASAFGERPSPHARSP